MTLHLTIEMWQTGKYVVAKCPESDFISQSKMADEARKNLFDVIDIRFEEMTAL